MNCHEDEIPGIDVSGGEQTGGWSCQSAEITTEDNHWDPATRVQAGTVLMCSGGGDVTLILVPHTEGIMASTFLL